jgi:2-phospho-L-lactate guanylyltransferase (CobY/MobA/RfbA family)
MLPSALIPVRIAPTAKKRLAHVLGPAGRMDLMQRLFDHVASVLEDAGLDVVALTDDGGLNAVVRAALAQVGAPALVVHADLPALRVEDVSRLLDIDGDVVIARSVDGGTNGLLLRSVIAPAFGVRSAHEHAARARRAGLVTRVVDIPGFARDIDDPASLTRYGASFLKPRP